jgi:hypothetical protein
MSNNEWIFMMRWFAQNKIIAWALNFCQDSPINHPLTFSKITKTPRNTPSLHSSSPSSNNGTIWADSSKPTNNSLKQALLLSQSRKKFHKVVFQLFWAVLSQSVCPPLKDWVRWRRVLTESLRWRWNKK